MRRSIPVLALALLAAGCGGSDRPSAVVLGSETVTLQQVQNAVFTPSCATTGCHAGAGSPFGLDLGPGEAYGNLVGVASAERPEYDRIDPGSAADSYLYMKVSNDPRILGDPMPAIGGALSVRNLELLAEWIEQGANP